MQELFDKIAELSEENIFEITLSYLEVYNECIYDLLIPEGSKKYPLIMREDSKDGITLPELSQHYPSSVDEVMKLVLQGNQNRTISPTLANAVSSRSHAVLQVTIRQRPKTSNISTRYTMATLSLIDLAGSERASATQNRGTRMVEGANINRSLLALGSCINALCRKSKNVHIPYRNSKLTRLLKFSLGGNCRTVMIVCISPTSTFYEETLNTLNYANRAKNINTRVSKNSTNVDLHVTQYTQVIANLRKEISQLKIKLSEKSQIPQRSITNGGPISRISSTNQVQSKNYEDFEEKRSQFKSAAASLLANENQREKISTQLKSLDQRIHILQEWLNSETPSESNSSFGAYYNGVKNAKIELEKRKLSLEKEIRQLSTQTNQKAIANRSLDELLRNASMKYDATHRSILELDLKLIQQQFLANKHEHSYNDIKHFSDQSNELLSTFMSINSQCLFGLKDVLNKCESQSIDTSVLNNIYMKSIEVFTKTNQLISKPSETQASLTSSPSRLSISSRPSVTDHLLHKLNPRSRPIPSAMASYKSPSAPKKSVRIDAPSPQRRFKPRVSEPPRPVTKFGNFKPKVDLFDIKKQSFISSTDLKKPASSTAPRGANTPSKPPVSVRSRASVLPRLPVSRVPRQPSTPQPKRRILNTVSETGSQTSSPTQSSKRLRPPTSFLPRPSTLGTPNKRASPSTRRLSEGIPSKPHFEGRPVFGKY
jgi:mevalonate kinase